MFNPERILLALVIILKIIDISYLLVVMVGDIRLPFKYKVVLVCFVYVEVEIFLVHYDLVHVGKLETECKCWSFFWLWCKIDATFKLVHDILTYNKAQADPIRVLWGGSLKKSKQLEQFTLFFKWNTNSSVDDWNLQVLVLVFILMYHGIDFNFSLLSNLDGIWLQPKQYLLDSLLIAIDKGAVSSWYIWFLNLILGE